MLRLQSPAKINLTLKILGKRPDGYHEIDTVMQTVSLVDTITFSLSEKDSFTCSDTTLPLDNTNLVIKAKNLFRAKTNIKTPIAIHLEKKIPHAAGLGGGSSNAATTLFGLNLLLGSPLEEKALQSFSTEIGSDIPFFFSTGSARCTGRGEKITAAPPLLQQKITIVKPPIGLSTAAVYNKWEDGDDDAENGLEAAALSLSPPLLTLKKRLLAAGFSCVRLSGSGSAFYCLGEGLLPPLIDHQIFSCIPIQRNREWY